MRAAFPYLLLMAILAVPLATPFRAAAQASKQRGSAARLQSELTQAQNAMRAGDLSGAEQGLRRALVLDPNSLVPLNQLGIVLARQGKPAEAIPIYQRALSLHPGDLAIRRNLAIAYFKGSSTAQHGICCSLSRCPLPVPPPTMQDVVCSESMTGSVFWNFGAGITSAATMTSEP